MEPDDIPVHDLLGVGGGPEPGPDELRAIVARAGRRRLRVGAVAVAAALAVGGVVGYAVSDHSPAATQTASSPAAAPTSNSGASAGAASAGGAQSAVGSATAVGQAQPAQQYTHLFTRTSGVVTIRGFLTNFPGATVYVAGGCAAFGPPAFEAEVSTTEMVGVAEGDSVAQAAKPVSAVESTIVGEAEGDPVAVVTATTGSGVAEVRMSLAGGGTDQMVPVKAWVALAAPVSAKVAYGGQPLGTLTALDAAGKILSSAPLTLGQSAESPLDASAAAG